MLNYYECSVLHHNYPNLPKNLLNNFEIHYKYLG